MAPKQFVTRERHRDAISLASSYAFNSGNKEAPWYGVQNRYLSDLLSSSMTLYPQYRLDLQSSLWQKRLKTSSAPNSTAAPNPAAPSSAPPSTAVPPAAAGPQPSTHEPHAAGIPQPNDEPVDLHLDDNSDPDELDALTADTHHTGEDSDEEKARFMAMVEVDAEEGDGEVQSHESGGGIEGDREAIDEAEAEEGGSGTDGDDEAEGDEDDEGNAGGEGGDEVGECEEGVAAPEAKTGNGDGVAVNEEGYGASESEQDEGEVEDEDDIVELEGVAPEETVSDGCTDDSEDEGPEDDSVSEDAGDDVDLKGDRQDVDDAAGNGQEHEEQRATQEDGANNLEDAHAPPPASELVPQGRILRSRANQAQAQTDATAKTDAPGLGQPANRIAHQYTSPFPDGRSDTSRRTLKDKKAISRYPDFGIAHTISAKMNSAPMDGEDAALHAVKLEIHSGRKTLHRCLLLIEEDKRAPSRRSTGQSRVDDIQSKLAQATAQLIEYLSAYFYAVPHSPGVVGRVTSGVYWKWLFITRHEVPQYDPIEKQAKVDVVNQGLLDALLLRYYEDTPTYILGDGGSDLALNAMRRQLNDLAQKCKKSH